MFTSSLAPAFMALLVAGAPSAPERAAHELAGLPRCAAPTATTPPDWKRTPLREGFSIAMPACFELAAEQPRFIHGGQEWRCEVPAGTVSTVTASWGMWTQRSFGPNEERCAAEIGGLPALVMISVNETRIWYLTGTMHEPVVSLWSKTADEVKRLQPVAWSGRGPSTASPK